MKMIYHFQYSEIYHFSFFEGIANKKIQEEIIKSNEKSCEFN